MSANLRILRSPNETGGSTPPKEIAKNLPLGEKRASTSFDTLFSEFKRRLMTDGSLSMNQKLHLALGVVLECDLFDGLSGKNSIPLQTNAPIIGTRQASHWLLVADGFYLSNESFKDVASFIPQLESYQKHPNYSRVNDFVNELLFEFRGSPDLVETLSQEQFDKLRLNPHIVYSRQDRVDMRE